MAVTDSSMPTVIVVGGGLAGISAALSMARQRKRVLLVEGRRRLGGRTGSFVDHATGEEVDYCQHVAMGCCHNFRKLLDWLGHSQHWQVEKELHFYGPNGEYRRLKELPLPAPLHLASWLLKWPGLGMRDCMSIVRGLLALKRVSTDEASEGVVAIDWLKRAGQSEAAVENFWRTIIVSALGEELDRVNLAAVAKVLQDGFMNARGAQHVLIPQLPLGQLFGCMAEDALKAAGVEVRTNCRVRNITSGENWAQVRLQDGNSLSADAIVVAVPWYRLNDLVEKSSNPELERIAGEASQITGSPISGIHTWWDCEWMDKPHATLVGRTVQWIFSKAGSTPSQPSNEHYYQLVISASRGLPKNREGSLAEWIVDDLSKVFPAVKKARLLRLQTVTDPQAVYSLSPQCAALRPRSHVEGTRLWLAGDWIRTGWPATMESAVLSGFLAADGVHNALHA